MTDADKINFVNILDPVMKYYKEKFDNPVKKIYFEGLKEFDVNFLAELFTKAIQTFDRMPKVTQLEKLAKELIKENNKKIRIDEQSYQARMLEGEVKVTHRINPDELIGKLNKGLEDDQEMDGLVRTLNMKLYEANKPLINFQSGIGSIDMKISTGHPPVNEKTKCRVDGCQRFGSIAREGMGFMCSHHDEVMSH